MRAGTEVTGDRGEAALANAPASTVRFLRSTTRNPRTLTRYDSIRATIRSAAGLLTRIRKCLLYLSILLNEADASEIRPSRQRDILPRSLTPDYLPQKGIEASIMSLAEETLLLWILADF